MNWHKGVVRKYCLLFKLDKQVFVPGGKRSTLFNQFNMKIGVKMDDDNMCLRVSGKI